MKAVLEHPPFRAADGLTMQMGYKVVKVSVLPVGESLAAILIRVVLLPKWSGSKAGFTSLYCVFHMTLLCHILQIFMIRFLNCDYWLICWWILLWWCLTKYNQLHIVFIATSKWDIFCILLVERFLLAVWRLCTEGFSKFSKLELYIFTSPRICI